MFTVNYNNTKYMFIVECKLSGNESIITCEHDCTTMYWSNQHSVLVI